LVVDLVGITLNTQQPDRRSRKHHYIPRLILRGFAKQGVVSTRDLVEGRGYQQSITNAAAENDYNTLAMDDGTKTDVAEKAIGAIESAAAPVLARIADGGWIADDAERDALAHFIVYQYLRVPERREWQDAVADLLLKLDMAAGGPTKLREVLEAEGENPTDEEVLSIWEDLREFDEWTISMPREHHLLESLNMLAEFTPLLLEGFSWAVVRWERRRLLTSDAPVLLVAGADWPAWRGVGLLTAGRILFPFTRTSALVLVNRADQELPDGAALQPTAAGARALNRLTATVARRRLYHYPEDSLYDLLGADFELRVPSPTSLATPHTKELRASLARMGEMVFKNPAMKHPLANLPVIEPPTNAEPVTQRSNPRRMS
jgi:hypothetical protein